jgi:hypothetical protein
MKTIQIFLTVLWLTAPLWARQPVGYTVSFLLGESSFRRAGAAWQPLKIGTVLALGDSLRTGDESRLELAAPSRDILKVSAGFCGALDAGLVTALTPAKRASGLSVLQGGRTENLQSPTAIAAIRGKAAGTDTTVTTETDPQSGAKELLNEAVTLRNQAAALLDAGNETAAAAALEQAENLTQRALAMLEE